VAETCDVVVVGLGAVGGATTMHLARQGANVVGLDRHAPPHRLGSSHGGTRITRLAVGEGDEYVPLVRRSHELWRELEAASGERLLVECGGLVLGAPGATGQHGVADFTAATIAVARRHGIDHEVLGPDELRERFGVLQVRDEVGYFEPTAGYLRVETCVAAQLAAAQAAGASLRRDTPALTFARRGDGVRVETPAGPLDTGTVVLAAGAWLPSLVPELDGRLTVVRQVQFWFDPDGDPAPFARLPIFIWLHGERPEDLFYGFPAVDGADGGVKVATETFGTSSTPEAVDRSVASAEASEMHRAHVAGRLAGLSARCRRAEACLYTVAPDFGFVVDALGDDRVLVVSACSGHGFKHAPAVGEALAARALGRSPLVDLGAFRLDRFAGA
jgi:sarcosine oxidase